MHMSAVVLSLMLGAAALAGAQQATTPTKTPKTTSHHTRHAITGEVVVADAAKSTLTFKTDKGELTWPVNAKAQAALKTLQVGDKITVSYAVDPKGEPKEAISIVKAHPPTPAATKK